MYGGIATAGADRIIFAQRDGEWLLLDVESGRAVDVITPHPFCPEQIEVGACGFVEGLIYIADTRHHRVRVFDERGHPIGLIGAVAPPGIRHPDEPGVLDEPVCLLPLDHELIVVSAGQDQENAVQRFSYDGSYRGSLLNPLGGYYRAHGAARIADEIWIAETEGGSIRRFNADGTFVGDVKLHTELQRPFRLADDGYGGVLALLAPESEEEQEVTGVARLERDGEFGGWIVGGDQVHLPFDIAVLADGRFVVADLPYGGPPDIRVQLFGADGRVLRTLVGDRVELGALRDSFFEQLAESDYLRRAQRAHFVGGGEGAAELYRLAHKDEPLLAAAGLGALLQFQGDPAGAEDAYLDAIQQGAPEADFRARIAQCRHDQGETAAAIEMLQPMLESEDPPEEIEAWLDILGTWYLEGA
ncbi:MAG: hypothetical protein ACYTEG_09505 [Planctomycetota bacterium]|jgi:hypothetical protein